MLTRSFCATGRYALQAPAATHLLVRPLDQDGHWSTRVDAYLSRVPCETIRDDLGLPWWQRAVGATQSRTHTAADIRIGVIDCIFERPPSLAHVDLVDDPAHVTRMMQLLGPDAQRTHGHLVTQILAGHGPGQYRGIAHDAEVLFSDASWVENGSLSLGRIDGDRVIDAIERLAVDLRVDLINVSCGFHGNSSADFADFAMELEDVVEMAADHGCLCVCSGGNNPALSPPIPASLESTVGVGGVGMCDIAPAGALISIEQRSAAAAGNVGAPVSGVGCFFHDPQTSTGTGINVAAPSIGIVLQPFPDLISDFRGTSWAAAIVCGVLACHLKVHGVYQLPRDRSRFRLARGLMMHATYSIGLNRSHVGDGLPHLP